MFTLGRTIVDTAIDDTIAIEYIQIDLFRYFVDSGCYPSERYCHAASSVIQPSVSDNRLQCDVFYSTKLETCKNTAHMLKSRYEAAGYYAFYIYIDGELRYSSDNFLNLNDQNKSFRYFIEN